jgi:hypothetical protein
MKSEMHQPRREVEPHCSKTVVGGGSKFIENCHVFNTKNIIRKPYCITFVIYENVPEHTLCGAPDYVRR